LKGAGRAESVVEPDELLQFEGERAILQASMSVAVLVFLYPNLDSLYQVLQHSLWFKLPVFSTSVAEAYSNQQHQRELATLLLLFATGATGIALSRTARWRRAPLVDRRASAFRNTMTLLTIFISAWAVLTIYQPVLSIVHKYLSALLFDFSKEMGWHGNNIAAVIVAVLAIGFSIAGGYFLHYLARRIEDFFVGNVPTVAAGTSSGAAEA
jgi:hypothetical protein